MKSSDYIGPCTKQNLNCTFRRSVTAVMLHILQNCKITFEQFNPGFSSMSVPERSTLSQNSPAACLRQISRMPSILYLWIETFRLLCQNTNTYRALTSARPIETKSKGSADLMSQIQPKNILNMYILQELSSSQRSVAYQLQTLAMHLTKFKP